MSTLQFFIRMISVFVSFVFFLQVTSAYTTYKPGEDTSQPSCVVKLGESACWNPSPNPNRHQAPYQIRTFDSIRPPGNYTKIEIIKRPCESEAIWTSIKLKTSDEIGYFEGCLKPFADTPPNATSQVKISPNPSTDASFRDIEGYCELGKSWKQYPGVKNTSYACLPDFTPIKASDIDLTVNINDCVKYGSTAQAGYEGKCMEPCISDSSDGLFDCTASYKLTAPTGRSIFIIPLNYYANLDFMEFSPVGGMVDKRDKSQGFGRMLMPEKYGSTNYSTNVIVDPNVISLKKGQTNKFAIYVGSELVKTVEVYVPCPSGKIYYEYSGIAGGKCQRPGVAAQESGLTFHANSFEQDFKQGVSLMKNFKELKINGSAVTLPTTLGVGQYTCFGCFSYAGAGTAKLDELTGVPSPAVFTYVKGKPLDITGKVATSLLPGNSGDGRYVIRILSYSSQQKYFVQIPIKTDGTWSSKDSTTPQNYQDIVFGGGNNGFTLQIVDTEGKSIYSNVLASVPFLATVEIQSISTSSSSDGNPFSTLPADATPVPITGPISVASGATIPARTNTTTTDTDSAIVVIRDTLSPDTSSLDAASKARIDKIIARVEKRVSAMIVENALKYLDSSIARIKALPNKNAKAKLIDTYTLEKLEDLRDTIAETETDYIGLIDTSLSDN